MNNNYCIYRHIKPNGEVFYIGIGNIKRPFERRHRNNIWSKTIKKYPNYEIDILKKNITIEEAKELEIILIDYYGRKCNKTGTLCNISLGGEGAFGRIATKEQRLKLSISHKGQLAWNKGLKHSNSHKENLKKNSGMAKEIINTETGEIYSSAAECARINNINYVTLSQNINGTRNNKTIFKQIEYGN
jgi:hypothetical protein